MRLKFGIRRKYIRVYKVVAIIALLAVGVVIFLAYRLKWDGTGFPGKTLWDWLNLFGVLAIPAAVGLGTIWFTRQQAKVSDAENKDNQREAALQVYIDNMSELLLHEHLGEAPLSPTPPTMQTLVVAQARTATILRTLDPGRRGSLIRFLSQAGILNTCVQRSLVGIDLHGVYLSGVNLSGVNLSEANLSGADLYNADLSKANLFMTRLTNAILMSANLRGATLTSQSEER